MIADSQREAFYEAERTDDLPLAVNDNVIVISGKRRGFSAAVISLEEPPPDPSYLIEFSDGSSAVVALSNMRKDDSDRKCIYAKAICDAEEEYFVAIYADDDRITLVTSEGSGGDAAIPFLQRDFDSFVDAIAQWKSKNDDRHKRMECNG